MSTMKDPCGILIGRRPTTLFEAQERACEIEENITSSLIQEEECLKETLQINQIDDFVSLDFPLNVRTYLQEEREKATERVARLMINLLVEEKEVTLRNTPCPPNEILEFKKRQAVKQAEEEFLQHIQQVLKDPHKERKVDIIKGEEKVFSLNKTKNEGVVDHVNITHQVLDEGFDNTFILLNSLFLDKENKEGSWGFNFDGAHSSTGLGAGIVLRSPDNETTLFSYRLEFNCTNNIAEHKALILGLNIAIDMNIKTFHVRGDSDLIVS